MSSKKVIIFVLLTIPIAGVIYEVTRNTSSLSAQVDNLEPYPWCSWSGAVKDGKPHGFGAGDCVYGQEPLTKQVLSPPLSGVQRQYLERAGGQSSLHGETCGASDMRRVACCL